MIVVRLFGGLGNQMFQYAAARRLAYKHNTVLKIDRIPLIQDGYRTYGLSCFNILENFVNPIYMFKLCPIEGLRKTCGTIFGKRISSLISRRIFDKFSPMTKFCQRYHQFDPEKQKLPDLIEGHFLSQRFYHFDPDVLDASDNVYMLGSWQSEKFFKDIELVIRNDFSFKLPQIGKNKEIAKMIQDSESVSVHIRGGDYINNKSTREAHETCGIGYYLRGVELIAEMVKSPQFFIFSDDIVWARKNLKPSFPTIFVDRNNPDYEDMRLMSQCRHNIIANSSFSWWGAWLNSNTKKNVIAPKKWLNLRNFNTKDVIPEAWIKLPCDNAIS